MVRAVSEYLRGASEVAHNRTLVLVGAQSPEDKNGKSSADPGEQCVAVWTKIRDALAEKNLQPRHIVAIDIDLADREFLEAALAEQTRHVRHHVARTVRVVGLIDPDWKLQVSVVASVTR
jgi:enamine deaminase RidA (YjgF/YER057c/UK114 family)